MTRKALVFAFVLFATLGWLTPAHAVSGKVNDPLGDTQDDMPDGHGDGTLDIVSNSHSDDGVHVTYVLTMKDPFGPQDVSSFGWALYDLAGLQQWDCPTANVGVGVKDGAFYGELTRCNGSGGGGESGPGGQDVLAPVTVTHANGSKTISVSYPIAALRSAGFTGSTIQYRAFATDAARAGDMVPNEDPTVTHKLSPPPTPVPVPATPQPTVAPTPQPTPAVTAEPTIAPTPGPTAEAVSFAAPTSTEGDGDASVPLRVAAIGSVLAAAGSALLVFRPF